METPPPPARRPRPAPRGGRERLYAENGALVGLCLARFPFLSADEREDAIGAGMLGLWHAAGRYDPSRGFTFSTYARDCIRGYVLHHLKAQRRHARLPTVSLETPTGADGETDLSDVIADDRAEKPGAALLSEAGFDASLSALPERQRDLMTAVYREERPLSDVAREWGLTKQRCGQIHLQALAALRGQKVRAREFK